MTKHPILPVTLGAPFWRFGGTGEQDTTREAGRNLSSYITFDSGSALVFTKHRQSCDGAVDYISLPAIPSGPKKFLRSHYYRLGRTDAAVNKLKFTTQIPFFFFFDSVCPAT